MHLSGRNRMALELRVAGYQFPDDPNSEYDGFARKLHKNHRLPEKRRGCPITSTVA